MVLCARGARRPFYKLIWYGFYHFPIPCHAGMPFVRDEISRETPCSATSSTVTPIAASAAPNSSKTFYLLLTLTQPSLITCTCITLLDYFKPNLFLIFVACIFFFFFVTLGLYNKLYFTHPREKKKIIKKKACAFCATPVPRRQSAVRD